MAEPVQPQDHFESMQRQSLAATLGMWIFLSSEILFFGALFTTYASYRARSPVAFAEAVQDNTLWWGSTNTVVLLTSSLLVALAVHELRAARNRRAAYLAFATAALGVVFLVIKGYEYYLHFQEGIFPGGNGAWFATNTDPGLAAFWTLYFMITGLHALHVIIGIGVLTVLGCLAWQKRIVSTACHAFENGGMYWHLVDIIWLFLWPLFYLTNGHS